MADSSTLLDLERELSDLDPAALSALDDQARGHWRERLARLLTALESGALRVAEPDGAGWRTHAWIKRAILCWFRVADAASGQLGAFAFLDKVPLRFAADSDPIERLGARVVPGAIVRRGAYIGADAVLMPSFVNIGAHVGAGTMVDTWATVGSCAQIGARVHLSGGVGIGGVLEPLQAQPTIIEDDCFIGARSEVVEGVIVERGAVLGMGVHVGQSTRIYDRESGSISHGRIPAGAVVVPGSLPSADGRYSLACAVIVKRVDARTRAKVGINALLRAATETVLGDA